MSWMLLIVEARGQRTARSLQEGRDLYQRMLDYGEHCGRRACCWRATRWARPRPACSGAAASRSVVDGPFTESKEFVGGFYLLDCQSREQALQIAAACPAVEWASVEVREVGPCYE